MMDNQNHNEAGYTLIGVLAIFTIVTILGISLVMLSITSINTSKAERDNQSVFYIAEGGLNYKMNEIEQAVKRVYKQADVITEEDFYTKVESILLNSNEIYKEFQVGDESTRAEITVELVEEKNNEYMIKSTGYLENESRTVVKEVTIDWENKDELIEGDTEIQKLPPFAVFTSGNFTMSNGHIEGDIGSINVKQGSVHFLRGGPTHNGVIYVPKGRKNIVINNVHNIRPEIKAIEENYSIPQLPTFPVIPTNFTKLPDQLFEQSKHNSTDLIKDNNLFITNWMTNNYTLVMNDDLEFNSIEINQNNKLFIDVGTTSKEMKVKHLDLTNGHIELKGKGNLTIYVTDRITMGSGSMINNNGDISRVNIFYSGTDLITLSGNQKIYGSLFAETANLHLTASGGIFGNIFTGGEEFVLSGGSKVKAQVILAPMANVKMMAGGEIEGMIICKNFYNEGGAKVTFGEPFILNGPISPAALKMNSEHSNEESNGENIKVETGASPTIISSPTREVSN